MPRTLRSGWFAVAGVTMAVLSGVVGVTVAQAAAPGTQYPSQKIVFSDPVTGKTVWRMTTDGSKYGALHLAAGDQSSESRSFSPDSTKIVYAKSGMDSNKADGVYMMDVASGVETYLASAPWYAAPIWSRDGSGEVYYYYGRLEVRAVNTVTYAVRTVISFPGAAWQEKLEVNADGTYISAHPRMSDGNYRTAIFTPTGQVLSSWTLAGPASDDGAVWSPSDPNLICAVRNGAARIWNVHTLAIKVGGCVPAHSAWHPNGDWFYVPTYLSDLSTGANVLPGTGTYPIHPNINPAEGSLGTAARMAADDRDWFFNSTGRPRLYVGTLQQFVGAGDFRAVVPPAAVHYSSMASNLAHAHPHWSWDGKYILWTSDVADLRDGTPPGGTKGGTDLFILPMSTSPSGPILGVSPTSLTFTTAQGGPAPASQGFTVSNTGGGTLSWTVSESASWLSVSVTAGTGNATVGVSVSPTGLAAGTYVSAITVSAGAAGSRTVSATLVVTALAPALSVSPSSLSFSTVQGGTAPAAQNLTISNTGGGTLSWSVSETVSWLSVSKTSGSGNATVAVSVYTSGLAAGTYSATVTISATGATGSPKIVTVNLMISPSSSSSSGKDLVIQGLALSSTKVAPGASTTVSHQVVNRGTSSVTETYLEGLYLSKTAAVDASAVSLGRSHGHTADLAANSAHGNSQGVTIPPGTTAGAYYIVVRANVDGAVSESSVANNTAAIPVTVGQTGSTKVTFDSPVPPGTSGSLLAGVFQGIDFGTGKWRWETAYNVDPSNHIYFDSGTGISRTFYFSAGPRLLESIRVFGVSSGTLTLTDNLGQEKVQAVTTGSMQSVATAWTKASTTVTVTFTAGWALGVDDITYR